MIKLDGGIFRMGTDGADAIPGDGEAPAREVEVAPFAIDAYAVTVHRFARFVEETGYLTDAEREGWSFVFAGRLADDFPPTRALAAAPWWRVVHGASWREPDGPGSLARADHPVVHVSHRDAIAFCAWAGARLPSEAEWEYAARAGSQERFPWGDELGEGNCNVFRGPFPDGFADTVPVDAYAPNAFGLHNVIGNVWEWSADAFGPGTRAIRGGSYTCHDAHCTRYRLSARTGNAPDASMGNLGFRVAALASREPTSQSRAASATRRLPRRVAGR